MTNKFSDNREKYLGWGESAAGLGCMVGPVLGSFFVINLGYCFCYIAFAIMLSVAGILSWIILPGKALNARLDVQSDLEKAESARAAQGVPYSWFFSSRRCLFSLASCTVVCLMFSFNEPFFTPALKDEKGVAEAYHGLIMAVSFVTYLGSCMFVGEIISLLPKRVFMTVSFTICILALLLLGPSRILGLPNSVYILIGGQALLGIGMGFVFIPIMPEMIDALYAAKGMQEGEDEHIDSIVADKAAGLYGTFYSTGMIVSPILGSLIFEHFD
jgi:MFS family permease